MRRFWPLAFGLSLVCCAGEPDGDLGGDLAENEQSIVYGADDRRDVYDDSQTPLRAIARTAVVALVPKGRLQRPATGEILFSATPLSSTYQLCKGQRFADQPTLADCTGVLIDSDLIVTAGHCVEKQECTDFHYVFDYFYRASGELEPVSANDVYGCRALVSQEISDRNGRQIDYAVIQLDRAVSGRTPLKLRSTAAADAEPLTVIGTGSGLPIKIDRGARVIAAREGERDYFMLEADTFEGSSGSAVVDREGALLGILVRGGTDYVEQEGQDCQIVNALDAATPGTLADGKLGHEEATYLTRAVEGACSKGFPSPTLCGRAGSCGDDFCSTSETRESCPRDCDSCAKGVCGARGDLRFAASASVKQSPGSGRAGDGSGCSLSPSARGQPAQSSSLLVLLALAAWRLRHRQT